mmetsp:Transcript_8618/g.26179  ORF Transcript_8618/g.26179 Transcript_8618/m.26179 type:complete len:270 (-) Transcript_8618:720-1529(-)
MQPRQPRQPHIWLRRPRRREQPRRPTHPQQAAASRRQPPLHLLRPTAVPLATATLCSCAFPVDATRRWASGCVRLLAASCLDLSIERSKGYAHTLASAAHTQGRAHTPFPVRDSSRQAHTGLCRDATFSTGDMAWGGHVLHLLRRPSLHVPSMRRPCACAGRPCTSGTFASDACANLQCTVTYPCAAAFARPSMCVLRPCMRRPCMRSCCSCYFMRLRSYSTRLIAAARSCTQLQSCLTRNPGTAANSSTDRYGTPAELKSASARPSGR